MPNPCAIAFAYQNRLGEKEGGRRVKMDEGRVKKIEMMELFC